MFLLRAFCTGKKFNKTLGFPIHRVFVSPFLICLQTASEVVHAICAVDYDNVDLMSSADGVSIDPSKLKLRIRVLMDEEEASQKSFLLRRRKLLRKDNEDKDWLEEYNKERKSLTAEKFEIIVFKFEVLDHKAREKAGVITPTLGAPIPVLLTFDAAVEALQALSIQYRVFQTIYNYWKEKRERWQKPVLRRLQVSICLWLKKLFHSTCDSR